MFNPKSVKTQFILYLGCLALWLIIKDKDFSFLFSVLVAVISTLVIEAFVLYRKAKTFRISESAVITGIIIGYVLSSDEAWWKFVFAAGLAIFSKSLIRFQKKHIFNPAAFAIFLSTILLGVSTQWKGTYLWYIMAPFGLYFAHKIKKTEVIIGYIVTGWLLFGIQAASQGIYFWNIFGYFSYFYIFVMAIEPKTTPVTPIGKYIFGATTAALIFILTEQGVKFDAELFSLLVMNATVPLLNKIHIKKGGVSMKRIAKFVVFLVFFARISTAYAHPPSDIKITFDPPTKMLQAVIMHNTNNPNSHYIKKVAVSLKGKEIIAHMISQEDNNVTQTVRYLIPDAQDGDVISVEGYCSISGKLKKEMGVRLGK